MSPMLEQVKGQGEKFKKLFKGEKEKNNKVWESKGNLIFGPKSESQSHSSATTSANSNRLNSLAYEVSNSSFKSTKSTEKVEESPKQRAPVHVTGSPIRRAALTHSPRSPSNHSPSPSTLASNSPSSNPSTEKYRKVIIRKADGTTTTRILKPGEELPKNVKKTPVRTHRVRRQSLGGMPSIPLHDDDAPEPANAAFGGARQMRRASVGVAVTTTTTADEIESPQATHQSFGRARQLRRASTGVAVTEAIAADEIESSQPRYQSFGRARQMRRASTGVAVTQPTAADEIESPQPRYQSFGRARQMRRASTGVTVTEPIAAGVTPDGAKKSPFRIRTFRRSSIGTLPDPPGDTVVSPSGAEPRPRLKQISPKTPKPSFGTNPTTSQNNRSPIEQSPLTPGLTPRQRYRRATMSHVTSAGIPVTPGVPLKRTIPRPPKVTSIQDVFDTAQWPETPALRTAASSNKLVQDASSEETVEIPTPKLPNTRLYEYARQCNWKAVSDECILFPRDAKCVEPSDGTTALHLAVMSCINPILRDGSIPDAEMAPLELIEQLVAACPEAGITRCSVKKYTPLIYACLVLDQGYNLQDGVTMVRSLLRHAPHSVYVFTDDGFSALDVHILSYSRFHRDKQDIQEDSMLVLRALLQERPDLAEARSYKNRVRGPLELLYRSNLEHFKDISRLGDFSARPGSLASPQDWWAWRWADLLLRQHNSSSEFKSLHAAAGLTGCPLPILLIAAQGNPRQLKEPVNELGNLPLHQVCMWICDSDMIAGDPFVLRRKTAAIESLLQLYPDAAKIKNNMGETPLQLAVESKTPFHGGLEALIRVYEDALSIPRKLRAVDDENDQLLSVDVYDDNESVDSDWVDPVLAVEGMYPFLVAAVVSFIPVSKRKPSFFSNQTPAQHQADLQQRELENLRTIYGLLRARPSVFGLYKPVFRKKKSSQIEEPEISEYTEIVEEDSDYTEVTFDE